MSKSINIILLIIAGSLLLLTLLHLLSNQHFHIKNGFKRNIKTDVLHFKKEIVLPPHKYYFSGFTANSIYLSNYSTPEILTLINSNNSSIIQTRIKTHDDNISIGSQIIVDSPQILIINGKKGQILKSCIVPCSYTKIIEGIDNFSMCMPISSSGYILRRFDIRNRNNKLVKSNLESKTDKDVLNILTAQGDGFFSTDGQLHFSRFLNVLVYVYYYRNEFLGIDTNLNLIYKRQTIDTNRYAKLDVVHNKKLNTYSLGASTLKVNGMSCIDRDMLFINSLLAADNQTKEETTTNTTIDVYSLTTQRYQFSFLIPNLRNRKLREFKVVNRLVIVLYDNSVATYQLNLGREYL